MTHGAFENLLVNIVSVFSERKPNWPCLQHVQPDAHQSNSGVCKPKGEKIRRKNKTASKILIKNWYKEKI